MFLSGVAHIVNHLHILAMFYSQKMVSMINNKFYLLDIFEQVPCHFLWFKSMSWSMLEMHSFVQASQPPLTILSVRYRHQVRDFWHWVGKGLDNLLDYFIRPWLHKTGMNSQWYNFSSLLILMLALVHVKLVWKINHLRMVWLSSWAKPTKLT